MMPPCAIVYVGSARSTMRSMTRCTTGGFAATVEADEAEAKKSKLLAVSLLAPSLSRVSKPLSPPVAAVEMKRYFGSRRLSFENPQCARR